MQSAHNRPSQVNLLRAEFICIYGKTYIDTYLIQLVFDDCCMSCLNCLNASCHSGKGLRLQGHKTILSDDRYKLRNDLMSTQRP